MQRTEHEEHGAPGAESLSERPHRRPYVAPVIESGEAFERVQLASGCNDSIEECEIPC